MPETPHADLAGRAHRALEPLHAMIYFAPEAEPEYTAVGLRPGRMGYFASRSAAMGPVSAGVVTATFYNFSPALVGRHIPRAWSLASVDDILAARLRAVDAALRRLLGADTVASADVREAAELARAATAGLPPEGRPLFAAHAGLPWPDEPHLVLWHAVTLLREFRGDGHLAALLDAGLTGLQALQTHTATGHGFTRGAAQQLRGWTDEEWADAAESLRARRLLDDEGLTAGGIATRDGVERATDRMAVAPWRTLGVEKTARLAELGKGLSRQVAANGAFPSGVFARSR
ncbi:hypothetical protein [uncultured Jatrophihabitans sp.]|uniref:SCO6745 family protein n=1 Tax=uncultured Jatrophihabitans sp. TaxID=1610747 RepID=UPI0035CA162E